MILAIYHIFRRCDIFMPISHTVSLALILYTCSDSAVPLLSCACLCNNSKWCLPSFGVVSMSEQHPARVKGHAKTMLIHGRNLAHDWSARLGHACVATQANKPAWSVCAKINFEAGLS